MTYAYQSFSSGQILTDGQSQQIEDNIRDHIHGKDGVAASGLSWDVTSKGSAFSIASTDAGKLFKVYGDFDVSFAAAATLGANFGAGFVNAGSGRVALTAVAGGFIHQHSYYALAPGEGVVVNSDATELVVIGANENVRLARHVAVGSMAQIDMTRLYPGDFTAYELLCKPNIESGALVPVLRYSLDSGSSYLATNYNGTFGDLTSIRFMDTTISSTQGFLARLAFANGQRSMSVCMQGHTMRGTGANLFVDGGQFIGYNTGAGLVNALRFMFTVTGAYGSGSVFELYGRGRVRR